MDIIKVILTSFLSVAALFVMFILFQLFSTCGLITNFITYPLIKKYMIDGFDPNTGERLEKDDN